MKELGEKVGCSESAISQYERGKRAPDYETLLRISEVLETSVDMLLRGEQKEAPSNPEERAISDNELKAAFFGGYEDDLSQKEVDELWDDARDYLAYKIEQKKKRKE